MAQKKHNRRLFLKFSTTALLAGFFGLWDRIIRSEITQDAKKLLVIPFSKNKSFIFHKKAIVVNKNLHTEVFSSHCTHLGCVISSVKDGKLVCPCHGSQFSPEGKPVKGPAIKPLTPLSFEINTEKKQIIIKT